jgi:aldose 1-epimerase
METITLAAGGLEAAFVPGAGMVCCSLRHDGEELLAQNDGLAEYAATGATMGIPLLHPWANRLGGWSYRALGRAVDVRGAPVAVDEHGLPIHGVLPGAWRVADSGADSVTADLEFGPGSGGFQAFPFPHRLRLRARLGAGGLRVETVVLAVDGPVPVAFGFHPYLTLPGVPRDRWHVRLPVRRHLVLDERQVPSGGAEAVSPYEGPLAGHAFDDGFDCLAEPPEFVVAGGGRRLEVCFEEGFPVAQVFAPPARGFVCFEPMTAPTNALRSGAFRTAAPGAPYAAAFTLSVAAG